MTLEREAAEAGRPYPGTLSAACGRSHRRPKAGAAHVLGRLVEQRSLLVSPKQTGKATPVFRAQQVRARRGVPAHAADEHCSKAKAEEAEEEEPEELADLEKERMKSIARNRRSSASSGSRLGPS